MMFSSTLYLVTMVIAIISIQAAPIALSTYYTGIAPYINYTNSTNGHHYTHPGTGISLSGLQQEHTNTSLAVDLKTDKKDDKLPTGVIVILAVGVMVICGGVAWLLHHIYIELA